MKRRRIVAISNREAKVGAPALSFQEEVFPIMICSVFTVMRASWLRLVSHLSGRIKAQSRGLLQLKVKL